MNDRLRIASILLGHLITCDQGKDLRARLPEVRHCIDLADLLIGLCETSSPACVDTGIVSDGTIEVDGVKQPDARMPPVPSVAKNIYERRRASLQSLRSRSDKRQH